MWLIFIGMKQKKFKILSFSTPPILNIFFQKFHGLVLRLVGLHDVKGIDFAQPNGGNCSAFELSWKTQFFEFLFASSLWKLVTNYVLEWMGLNFYYYDGLQPKMRAGIINEHECIWGNTVVDKLWLWLELKGDFK